MDDCMLRPLLEQIDSRLARGQRFTLAIEGGSAAGKTTLAAYLRAQYGCPVFHTDDFFLQPWQRTPERLEEPGGNMDRERFRREVLLPLERGEDVLYRRFDCHTMALLPPERIPYAPLRIVEGVYCMHPALAGAYGLSVFLSISREMQRRRIFERNTPAEAQRFFTRWIPLEEAYFHALQPQQRCSMVFENRP